MIDYIVFLNCNETETITVSFDKLHKALSFYFMALDSKYINYATVEMIIYDNERIIDNEIIKVWQNGQSKN